MALKVSVQANVQQALSNLSKLKRALHEVGQAGKTLEKISAGDDKLGGVADQFDRVRDNFYSMKKDSEMRRVMSMASRHGYQSNDPLSYVHKISGFYANQAKGEQLQSRFAVNLSNGMGAGDVIGGGNMAAAQAAQAQQSAGGGSLIGRAGRYAWNTASNAISMGLGMAGLGSVAGGLYTAFRENTSLNASTETIQRHLTSGQGFDELRDGIRDLARTLQLTSSEAGKLSEEFAHASGSTRMAFDLAGGAGQFGRGLGMDPSVSAGLFGKAALLGVGQDKASQRDFAALLANTIGSSHMFARSEQVMEDLVGHIGDIANREGRTASTGEMSKFAGLLSSLYQVDALRGGGAQNIMAGLSNLGGGGDLTKDMFAWSAFGKAAKYDYITMESFKDASPFATIQDITGEGSDTTTKLDLAWSEAKRQSAWLPGGNAKSRQAYMLKLMTGMKMPLSEAAASSLDRMYTEEGGFGQFKGWLGGQNIDINKLNPEGLGNLAKLYGASKHGSMGTQAFTDMAREYAGDTKTSQADRDKLNKLLQGDPAELVKALPEIVARTGASGNEAELARIATTNLTNTLEERVGPPIRDLVTWLSGTGATVIGKVGDGLEKLPSLLEGLTTALNTHMPALTGWLEKIGGWLGIGAAEASTNPMGTGPFGGTQLGTTAVTPTPEDIPQHQTFGDRVIHNFRRLTGGNLAKDPYFRGHIAKLEKERGIPAGMLAKIMMTESGGENRGYHYKDGSYNPMHSDYGLFGIKKDYTGKDPGYGVQPLQGTAPEEQARFAADYLAAAIKATGGPESGMAAFHTGIGGWIKGDPKTRADGNKYVDYTNKKVLPNAEFSEAPKVGAKIKAGADGITDVSGLAGSFGYKGYGKLAQKKAFIMHHTGGRGTVEGVQRTFGERDFPAHFVIDREGKIFRTLPEGQQGRHIRSNRKLGLSNVNTEGVEIIAKDDKDVLPAQIQAANRLRKLLGYSASQVYGHGEINPHKQKTEGHAAAEAVRMADAVPKTPADQDRVVRELTTPNQANARVDGHHTLDIVMRNADGKQFYQRRGLALSEPQVFGSPGERKVWSDTATMPAS